MELKTKAAFFSVIINTVLIVFKAVVGIMSGSVSIVSEAIHSGLDLIAALVALFSVRASSMPPDEQHRYGHGKIENVAGTVEALLIFGAAVWIIVEAWDKLVSKTPVEVEMLGSGLLVMLVSTAANWLIYIFLMRVARKTSSITLEADALHHLTDVYTSAGVVLGLGVIYFTGWEIVDPLVAIGVALLIIKASIGLTRVAFMPLLDTALPEKEEMVVRGILERYRKEGKLNGFHKLRTRQAGAERHVDVHLVMPGNRDLLSVHDLTENIEREIKERLDNTTVVIHMEPCCSEAGKDCSECETYLKMAKPAPGDKRLE